MPSDTAPLLIWLQFGACALLIAFGGTQLSRYGDIIGDKTGLSASWIGIVLLATVTSLPELVSGISSVTLADVPDIAVGNVLGSCMVNLAMLVVVDFLYRHESFYRRASRGHILSAGFGIVLIGFTALNLQLRHKTDSLAIGHVGIATPILFLLYALAVRSLMTYEREQIREFAEDVADRYPGMTLRDAVTGYALSAIVVVLAGTWLPFVGARLAQAMGWHDSFVGTLFIAGATTLPELAVTVSALRIGALDMAVANLLGSNLFNIVILAIDDLLFLDGPILANVSPIHAISAISAMIMTGTAILGLTYRPKERLLRTVGWVSVGLFTIFLLNSYVLYRYGD